MQPLTRTLLAAATGGLLAAAPAAAAPAPHAFKLPPGFSAEAMTAHDGALYVGSQVNGEVLRIDVRTGEQTIAVLGRRGVHSNGIRFAGNRIVVAGGTTGRIFIYDAHDGAPVKTYDVHGGFVNGVGIRGRIAYATDTIRHVVYAFPASGRGAVRTITLGGSYRPNALDLDGIIPAGNGLLTGQYGTGILYRVDPATNAATTVDLGGATVATDDGLLLSGRRLYVAENSGHIAEVQLNAAMTAGKVVKTLPAKRLRDPVDVARIAGRLYVLNAHSPQQPARPTDRDEIVDLGKV